MFPEVWIVVETNYRKDGTVASARAVCAAYTEARANELVEEMANRYRLNPFTVTHSPHGGFSRVFHTSQSHEWKIVTSEKLEIR